MNTFLFVCTMNMLRSPTGEHVARTMGYSADSAGTDHMAVRRLSAESIQRADYVMCMDIEHARVVWRLCPERPVYVLDIPDEYGYCDPVLVDKLRTAITKLGAGTLQITGP